jgi:GR25 family glycosyltransferase involved in LPS biosynthesis
MKLKCIVIKDNKVSETGYKNLINSNSSKFKIERFDATTPETLEKEYKEKWTYPTQGNKKIGPKNMILTGYTGNNIDRRISCTASHHKLWKECYESGESYIIFEHDAVFIKSLPEDIENKFNKRFTIISLNNPLGTTRRSSVFLSELYKHDDYSVHCPYVDSSNVPQGLPGNSCYYIKPLGAEQLLNLCDKYGYWPNDAIMCNQLINTLGCVREGITSVQNLVSTTTVLE